MTNAELSPRFELIPRSGVRNLVRVTVRRQDTACLSVTYNKQLLLSWYTDFVCLIHIAIRPNCDPEGNSSKSSVSLYWLTWMHAKRPSLLSLPSPENSVRHLCPLLRTQLIISMTSMFIVINQSSIYLRVQSKLLMISFHPITVKLFLFS